MFYSIYRNTVFRFSNCRSFFFPFPISTVNSSRVFSLGFVMGSSILPMGIENGQSVSRLPLWSLYFVFTVYYSITKKSQLLYSHFQII